ncbi:MAG: PKD domain-containing protein [Methylococcales bacterium]
MSGMDFTNTVFCRVMARILILTMTLQGFPVLAAPPLPDAGPDQIIDKTETNGGHIILDGSGSFDPDADPLSDQWLGPFGALFGSIAPAFVPEGLSTVSLLVDDGTVTAGPDTATVEVLPCFTIDGRAKPGKVQVTWPPQPSAQQYEIYRSPASAPSNFVKIGQTPSGYSTYLDDPVVNEITWLYQVNAVSATGSCFSSVASTHPTVSRVLGLNYTPVIYSSPITQGYQGIVYNYDVQATDPNRDPLTFNLVNSPSGMTIDPFSGLIHWIPGATGTYRITVEVSDARGGVDSQSFDLKVDLPATPNRAPSANAGPDQTVRIGDPVTLDGSGSTDPEGSPLTYFWTFASMPSGSTVFLSDPTAVNPVFTVDLAGSYVLELVVNDGLKNSAPDRVTITTVNSPPVADAGPDQTAQVGDRIQLDGSASSDVDGDPLTYRWSLTSPAGSHAALSDPTAVMPAFDIDLPGTYAARLIVNDGVHDSLPDIVLVTTKNTPPVANAGADQTVLVGQPVNLDGSHSSDVDRGTR